ncbi:ATP-binding protein [Ottowia sp.]|uniref:AAA family ATPase n=1 Tax=Ottowia sp. TaxID=1898956 RepID=UPI002D061533|nr:ATP-binding protein [Ottowia sp.]HRN76658.1 ATP-binding protein [Ottowia sp.]HRQ03606.1 ATP-binding protein [Ottowia sp.]
MPRLIFFCGHAGTGKTTIARRAIAALMAEAHARCSGESFCLLDKDTLYGDYSSAVMGVLTGDPDDRDSPPYLQHLRDPEYHGLLNTARENLGLGVNTIVVGPLSREIRAHKLIDRAWLKVAEDVELRIVWVHLQENEARRRIAARGNRNDAWKLAHWDDYRSRLFRLSPQDYPELLMFDNTRPTEQDFTQLLAALA